GQASYAAANAFLDAFAYRRAQKDAHALSLDWGAWRDVGMAASEKDRADNLARQGLATLGPDEGAELFDRLLSSSARALVPFPVDLRQWRQANPRVASLPLLSELLSSRASARTSTALVEHVRKAPSEIERLDMLRQWLRSAVASLIK